MFQLVLLQLLLPFVLIHVVYLLDQIGDLSILGFGTLPLLRRNKTIFHRLELIA